MLSILNSFYWEWIKLFIFVSYAAFQKNIALYGNI